VMRRSTQTGVVVGETWY